MQQLETKMVPVDSLVPYANNAKIHTEAQIDHIRKSIRNFGFNDPVGVWTNAQGQIEIVNGHGSVIAAKEEGMAEVPCNFLDHLTDEERREYCHVHNQTQLETSFDYEALTADMDNLGLDWESFGFEKYCYQPEALFEPEQREEKEPQEQSEAEPSTCPNCGYVLGGGID